MSEICSLPVQYSIPLGWSLNERRLRLMKATIGIKGVCSYRAKGLWKAQSSMATTTDGSFLPNEKLVTGYGIGTAT